MKRLIFGIVVAVVLFAQNTGPVTVTIPADVARAFERAHQAEYQKSKERSDRMHVTMTEETDPVSAENALAAELATMIADKVLAYAAAAAPAKRANESDTDRRNRYQKEIRSKIRVK